MEEMKLEVDFKPRAGQQWYATNVYRVLKCANALYKDKGNDALMGNKSSVMGVR